MTDSERAELVRIIERLRRPETIEAMVNLKEQIGAFGIVMVKSWQKRRGERVDRQTVKIEKKHIRKNEAWWRGQMVMSTVELCTGRLRIPEMCFFSVTGKHGGLNLETDACPFCGVKVRIRKVLYSDLRLVLNDGDGQKMVKNGTSVVESENGKEAVDGDDT